VCDLEMSLFTVSCTEIEMIYITRFKIQLDSLVNASRISKQIYRDSSYNIVRVIVSFE